MRLEQVLRRLREGTLLDENNDKPKTVFKTSGGLYISYHAPVASQQFPNYKYTLGRLGRADPRGRKLVYPSDTDVKTIVNLLEKDFTGVKAGVPYKVPKTLKTGELIIYGCIDIWIPAYQQQALPKE